MTFKGYRVERVKCAKLRKKQSLDFPKKRIGKSKKQSTLKTKRNIK